MSYEKLKFKLKTKSYFALLLVGIILLPSQISSVQGVQSTWSSAITIKNYHWKAMKSELRDLDTNEQYNDAYLIGGINIPQGIATIKLRSNTSNNFDFFNNNRLKIDVEIGDIALLIPQYESDYHLALLPISINNSNFFEVLFEEKNLLENLTQSTLIDSEINETTATVTLKFNDLLDVYYEWDVTSGILMRKEVTAPSGLQLIVVQTNQVTTPGWSFLIFFIVFPLLSLYTSKRGKKKPFS
ncbi:MAG: hypothetical protein FK733_06945 [Asgard group archaeon]|nr:hypothetical protein [Asgard group archaeon]